MTPVVALLVLLAMDAPAGGSPRVLRERVGPMVWARITPSGAALTDGRALVTGGSAFANDAPVPWAEVFDPKTRQFTATGSMNVPRCDHVCAALRDGRVLVAGGWRSGMVVATNTAETWDPATGLFTPCGDMAVERGSGIVWLMLDDGRILLVGGTAEGEFGTATDSVDVFDPATDTFAHLGHLVMARADAGLLRLDADHVLVFAGDYRCCGHPANAERKRSQEILDLRTGQSAMAGDWSVGELLAIEGVESAPVIQSATGPAQLLSTGKPPGFGTAVNLGDWVGGGFPLAPGLVLGGDDNLAVLDPATGSVAPALEDDVRYRAPVVLLGPGAALVTVAPPDERPCADAYLVTVR